MYMPGTPDRTILGPCLAVEYLVSNGAGNALLRAVPLPDAFLILENPMAV